MATETLRRLAALWCACVCALVAAPLPVEAQATPAATPTPLPSGEPWWVPVAFAGTSVVAVRAVGGHIAVETATGGQQASDDGGRTWHRIFERHGLVSPAAPEWTISDGRAAQRDAAGSYRPDPRSPSLGGTAAAEAGRQRIAAPAALRGSVVAVDGSNQLWRRAGDGSWARALVLLPRGITGGTPQITAVTAFDHPVSAAVYLATAGYSVLVSTDGGDDWVRAGPGLPDDVLAITADSQSAAVYAGTDNGLYVHHLQALPTPPVYADAQLHWRLLGIALVTVAAAALGTAVLHRALG